MNYLKISFGIFVALAASRFIPHPPNFTSLLALSFYVPALLGARYLPALIFSFVVTDIFIGFHSVVFFTWGSVILVGLSSKFFKKNILNRVLGSLLGACLFFIITNFGVWISGTMYTFDLQGLITCYVMALPFFKGTLLGFICYSTFLFGALEFSKRKFQISKNHI